MTMLAGTVSVDDNGNATGSGYAYEHFQKALSLTQLPDPANPDGAYGPNPLPDSTLQALAQARLSTINALATAANLAATVVQYILDNAVVTLSGAQVAVTPTTVLGRLPATMTAGTPIQGPAVEVDLPVTGGGTLT
jgi:hypothetical protein